MRAKSREPLDTTRILRAAIMLADQEGIKALSMRRLGQTLGVEAMSLYNHIANKEALLDGIVDQVFGDVVVEATAGSWKAAMRKRAIEVRETFARHPWAVGLLESRRNLGPATLLYCESVLRVLRQAGFSPEMAMRAFSVLDSYSYGYCIQEKSLPSGQDAQSNKQTEEFLNRLPHQEFPYLAEAAARAMRTGVDFAKEYEHGLDLILSALAQELRSKSRH